MVDVSEKDIWIIGANSDLAKAFIAGYGQRFGKVYMASRSVAAMEDFASTQKCSLQTEYMDIMDLQSVQSFVDSHPTPYGVLICAGFIACADGVESTTPEDVVKTCRTNFEGVVQLCELVCEKMRTQGEGFCAFLSSAAGDVGKASNRIYTASKSALSTYAEGLSELNRQNGVRTILLKIGQADTKMLSASGRKHGTFFLCSPKQVADVLFSAIQSGRSKIIYCGKMWRWLMRGYGMMPAALRGKLKL